MKAGEEEAGGAVVEDAEVAAVVGCTGDTGEVDAAEVAGSVAEGGTSTEVVCAGGGTTSEVVWTGGGTSTDVVCTGGGTTTEVVWTGGGTTTEVVWTGGGTTTGTVGWVQPSVQVDTDVTVIVLVWVTGCV